MNSSRLASIEYYEVIMNSKKLLMTLAACQALIGYPMAHAKSNEVIDQTFQYAAPCEDVKPESDVLRHFSQQLKTIPKIRRNQIIEEFWQSVEKSQTPIVEKINSETSRVIYLWRGAQYNVRLVGGPSNDHEWLTKLPDTDIWFKEAIVKNDFIGSYNFAVDIENVDGYLSNYCPHLNTKLKESREQRMALRNAFQLDPYNSKRFLAQDIAGLRNENLLMLDQAPVFVDPAQYAKRELDLKTLSLKSTILKNERKITIYQSTKNNPQQSYITAIFFDGNEYANLVNVPKTLDILVEQGKLPPIQAVFIDPLNAQIRPKELTPNADFSQFFQKELLPWLDQQIKRDTEKTVLLGSSLGGLSAAYLALENPTQISHVVPLSGSFWWQKDKTDEPNGMSHIIRDKTLPIKQHWFISANSYETSRAHNELSILNTSPIVANDLKEKGQDVVFKSYTGGHSYAVWQVVIQDALQYFFANK